MSTDLAQFLLARIAEDEHWASESGDGEPGTSGYFGRVLAECEAKRRVVALHRDVRRPGWGLIAPHLCSECGADGFAVWPCETLRLLALPYADHPDYHEEWRP